MHSSHTHNQDTPCKPNVYTQAAQTIHTKKRHMPVIKIQDTHTKIIPLLTQDTVHTHDTITQYTQHKKHTRSKRAQDKRTQTHPMYTNTKRTQPNTRRAQDPHTRYTAHEKCTRYAPQNNRGKTAGTQGIHKNRCDNI